MFFPFWALLRETLFVFLEGRQGCVISERRLKRRKSPLKLGWFISAYRSRPKKKMDLDFLFLPVRSGNIHTDGGVKNIFHSDFAHHIASKGYSVGLCEMPTSDSSYQLYASSLPAFCSDYIAITSVLKTIFKKASYDIRQVESFLVNLHQYIVEQGLVDLCYEDLKSLLLREIKRLPLAMAFYDSLFKYFQPKFVVAHCIAYGMATNLALVNVARNKGIKLIENQHGYVGSDHIAYVHSPRNHSLPDYFWLYGEFWTRDLNLTGVSLSVIGSPAFSKALESAEMQRLCYDFLFITDSSQPELTMQLLNELVTLFPRSKVLFRPHPSEMHIVKNLYLQAFELSAVSIDLDRNIYHSIAKSRKIIICGNYISTVAYEALGFGKQVFVLASNLNDIARVSGEGIKVKVIDISSGLSSSELSASFQSQPYSAGGNFYAKNWEYALDAFLEGIESC